MTGKVAARRSTASNTIDADVAAFVDSHVERKAYTAKSRELGQGLLGSLGQCASAMPNTDKGAGELLEELLTISSTALVDERDPLPELRKSLETLRKPYWQADPESCQYRPKEWAKITAPAVVELCHQLKRMAELKQAMQHSGKRIATAAIGRGLDAASMLTFLADPSSTAENAAQFAEQLLLHVELSPNQTPRTPRAVDDEHRCPECGSAGTVQRTLSVSRKRKRRYYKCPDGHTWNRDRIEETIPG